jgi:hypothetical protein
VPSDSDDLTLLFLSEDPVAPVPLGRLGPLCGILSECPAQKLTVELAIPSVLAYARIWTGGQSLRHRIRDGPS